MYNETRHVVCVFKDFLIFDDFSEYLKRIYNPRESKHHLTRTLKFLTDSITTSISQKQLPSYVGIPESRYLIKNMDKKRKLVEKARQRMSPEKMRSSSPEMEVKQSPLEKHKNVKVK